MSRDRKGRMTPPWTRAELDVMHGAAVPHAVMQGMWIAAWARAEGCPLNILAGRLEPHSRFEPSNDLWAAVGQGMGNIVGAMGFAIPIRLDPSKRAFAASWPVTWETN